MASSPGLSRPPHPTLPRLRGRVGWGMAQCPITGMAGTSPAMTKWACHEICPSYILIEAAISAVLLFGQWPSHQRRASISFLRRYRDGGKGLRLVVMYDHTCQPPRECDDYEMGKMAVHCFDYCRQISAPVKQPCRACVLAAAAVRGHRAQGVGTSLGRYQRTPCRQPADRGLINSFVIN